MSTTVKSVFGVPLVINGERSPVDADASVAITPAAPGTRFYDRADLLAAVATECDAIVIDRAELPEVTTRPGYSMVVYIDGGVYSLDIEARRLALEFLALAEYQDAHPPIDEAQVEALAAIVRIEAIERNAEGDQATWVDIARRLVARGVRVDLP